LGKNSIFSWRPFRPTTNKLILPGRLVLPNALTSLRGQYRSF
jgi:hypothetical protein